ncbi:MAG: hypothetical protein IKK33_04460 [Lachnospiraceae bacterium]|nr:hypothetical protein [Lachnospiraceae bacterium]
MFEHVKIQNLDDYFKELSSRSNQGVYFYRINAYTDQVRDFVVKYYEAARTTGVVIEGRIPNPDEKNLAYYNEIMGNSFQVSKQFLDVSLRKWLPRMSDYQRNTVAGSIYDTLVSLQNSGKNENMLKNAYIKFMCWLYYKFERVVNQLGNEKIPKILYEGSISNYELMLIEILANAGCDVVLLQYGGDANYLKLDSQSRVSDNLTLPNMKPFPSEFNLKWVRDEIKNKLNRERLYGKKPEVMNCTNAWIQGKGLADLKVPIQNRGNDPKLFYNCFLRITGVEDKLTYMNDLYQLQLELKNSGRKLVIVDKEIMNPDANEINSIQRKNYSRQEDMIMDLSTNIRYTSNAELQRVMIKAFVDAILEEGKQPGISLNKLTNKAVILLCWLKRYQDKLFHNWKMPEIGVFIYMGGCKNENEAMFLRYLSRLPLDVAIFVPNLNTACCLQDNLLFELKYSNSLMIQEFPQESTDIHVGTAAYHAERELDTIMYNDSGMYRNQQYSKATTVILQTMCEEISILWPQEVKYRHNFSTVNDMVTIPVIFAKVSGVKDGDVTKYWQGIKALLTQDTFLIQQVPFLRTTDENPFKQYATEFFKNGKLQKAKIKAHPSYQYGVLREEIQEHILDKLQLLIDQKIIKGTFENGTEYTIIATILNLQKELIRMIQKFDFTKMNPKIVYINTTETPISLEDSILIAFLSLVGFDIVFFVPTGYQSIEKHFNKKLMEEHQAGDYVYDLQVPNFNTISAATKGRQSWREKIFKRGS